MRALHRGPSRLGALLGIIGLVGSGALVAGCGADPGATRSARADSTPGITIAPISRPPHTPIPPPAAPAAPHPVRPRPPFAVGMRVLALVDNSRLVRFPGGRPVPRKLVTLVRYPATGPPTRVDVADAAPERAAGAFPLVVFGHGFAVTPDIYARLLQAWARAGYVVAAPVFPLENANAPGGPNESDLVNQPRDMSLVISRLLAANVDPASAVAGLIDPRSVAVTGQSDGGETALAVAYDHRFLDPRVRAAMILSGAEIPGLGGFYFPAHSPPLLATQGTADVVNPPSLTHAFFDIAPAPRYLLSLFGAPHLGPYTDEQPQLGLVEAVTIAFLDRYLKNTTNTDSRLIAAGEHPGTSTLEAHP